MPLRRAKGVKKSGAGATHNPARADNQNEGGWRQEICVEVSGVGQAQERVAGHGAQANIIFYFLIWIGVSGAGRERYMVPALAPPESDLCLNNTFAPRPPH